MNENGLTYVKDGFRKIQINLFSQGTEWLCNVQTYIPVLRSSYTCHVISGNKGDGTNEQTLQNKHLCFKENEY